VRAHPGRPCRHTITHALLRLWETAARVLAAAGQELTTEPRVEFVEHALSRGRTTSVPTNLPRLPLRQALATITLPLHLNWTQPNREFKLSDRDRRARLYEIVLREGTPEDVLTYIDGALLVDLWDSLVLPDDVRTAWSDVVDSVLNADHFRPFEIQLENGSRQRFDSIVFANISQMAKVAAVSEDDRRPDDGKFEVITVKHTAKWRLLGAALKAAVRGLGPQPSVHEYHFTNLNKMPIQVDGEVMELGAGAKARIDIAHQVMQTVL
jgi:hypothetical protein